MKKSLAIIAAVGVASAASAQSDGWNIDFDVDRLSPAEPTAWVTLSATFPAADYAFAGARVAVSAGESGWGDLELISPGGGDPATGSSFGVATGGDVTGIIVGQIHFPPAIIADPSNPQPVWRGEFTVTDFAERTIDFSTDTIFFRIYTEWGGRTGRPIEGEGSIRVVPAPAGLALLGLGGLAAARRRRQASSVPFGG